MRVLTFDGWDVFRKAVWVSFLSFGTYTEGGDQGCVCVCVCKRGCDCLCECGRKERWNERGKKIIEQMT